MFRIQVRLICLGLFGACSDESSLKLYATVNKELPCLLTSVRLKWSSIILEFPSSLASQKQVFGRFAVNVKTITTNPMRCRFVYQMLACVLASCCLTYISLVPEQQMRLSFKNSHSP